jgi:hypothetical protein
VVAFEARNGNLTAGERAELADAYRQYYVNPGQGLSLPWFAQNKISLTNERLNPNGVEIRAITKEQLDAATSAPTPMASVPMASTYGDGFTDAFMNGWGMFLAFDAGLMQGVANTANGVQNFAIDTFNLSVQGLGLFEIPHFDWSSGLLVNETPFAHELSKNAGTFGVTTLGGLWAETLMASEAAPFVIDDIEAGIGRLIRARYRQDVYVLEDAALAMRASGVGEEATARALYSMRRELGIQYKALTPQNELERIFLRNVEKYGDPFGPSIDYLQSTGKTWQDIIDSAARVGGKDLGY